jgi:DMSO reductase anchor subunit
MNPALSVIVFTTLSGAGLGLLAWFGLAQALGPLPLSREIALLPLGVGVILLTAGLASAFLHLGRPGRAWRAFSQWRSSWLSREAIAATLTILAAVGNGAATWSMPGTTLAAAGGAALAVLALATVVTTAGIYFSLRPIPAWHNGFVAPTFLLAAAVSGAAWWWFLLSLAMWRPDRGMATAFAAGALAFAALKVGYWRHIDRITHADTGAATGLHALGRVRPAEAPHTESNYLLREMGFALARRHARRLRPAAVLLAGVLPALAALAAIGGHGGSAVATGALLSLISGVFVERWLFFAEARHVVIAYYRRAHAD